MGPGQTVLLIDPPVLSFVPSAGNVDVDLSRLLAGRLLIQASSGGGKSWLIRQMLEQLADVVPQLIIDREGEFANLREIYHYVVIGTTIEGYEVVPDIELDLSRARLVCRQLMTKKVSVIIDLSEADEADQKEYVSLFLDELMRIRKKDWHTRLVVIDEADEFCPEGADVESSLAVKRLVSRGRKRGFGTVLATQRLSKLNKSASEVQNRIFGMTDQDVDLVRAAGMLGFNKSQAQEIKRLQPGRFYTYGRAIGEGHVQMVRSVDQLRTAHPDGTLLITSPPTPAEIQEAFKSLEGLTSEDDPDTSRQELQEEIDRLERALAEAKAGNTSDPADIRRAIDATARPFEAEIHRLQLHIERMKSQVRLILIECGELPPDPLQTSALTASPAESLEIEEPALEMHPKAIAMLEYLRSHPGEVSRQVLAKATRQPVRSGLFRRLCADLQHRGLATKPRKEFLEAVP